LESEIIAFIEKQFRASGERILFGWEAGGGFVMNMLSDKPELFDAYLAASPTPIFGSYFPTHKKQFQKLEKSLSSSRVKDKFLYFTQSNKDFPVHYGIVNLVNLLESKASKSMRWKFKKLSDELHPTTPFNTIFHGVGEYYFDYSPYELTSFQEFKQKGAFAFLDNYNKARTERYGFTKEQNSQSMKRLRRGLVISSITMNDFAAFEFFMDRFEKNGFLDELFLPHAYWIGRFYLEHDKPGKASEIFSFLTKKFERKARAFQGLGDLFRYKKDYKNAQMNYTKAIELAKETSDWRLSEYESALLEMNTLLDKVHR
jgi:hypothetical protein